MTSTPFCDCCNKTVPSTIGVDLPKDDWYPVRIIEQVTPGEYQRTHETHWIIREELCVPCFVACALYEMQERLNSIELNFQRALS